MVNYVHSAGVMEEGLPVTLVILFPVVHGSLKCDTLKPLCCKESSE